MRVLGAFKDLSKSVGNHGGNGGSSGLFGIKFDLDFHCRKQQNGPEMADKSRYEEEQYWRKTMPRLFMRAMMALMLHLGGVDKYLTLIWGWSGHPKESGDLHFS